MKTAFFLLTLLFFLPTSKVAANELKKLTLQEFASQQSVAASEVYKEPRVLIFWASWCQSCTQNFQAVKDSFDEKTIQKHVRTIALDQDLKTAQTYFEGKPQFSIFKNLSYLDSKMTFANSLKVSGLPAVLVIDKQGKVAAKWESHLDASQRQEMIRKLAELRK